MQKLILALTADDSRKDDMVSLIRAHREEIAGIELVATKNTGKIIQARLGLAVTLLESGLNGGYQQIGALVVGGEISAIISLRDPLSSRLYEADMTALLRVCDIHDVPAATNLTGGEAVIHLVSDHPEALNGYHLTAQYLEDIAAIQE
jgi:methylglyoxal synthase